MGAPRTKFFGDVKRKIRDAVAGWQSLDDDAQLNP